MCGIVGYFGRHKASDVIISGLEKLEYRGYDSCGICFYDVYSGSFVMYKDKGRVAHLKNDFDYARCGRIGIGHTRWATHGQPNQVNSHPHFSAHDRYAVVHNGVIENYRELTDRYLADVPFVSETDTEVVADLIERFAETMPVEVAIRKTLSLLEGSYALLILDLYNPERLYAAKNKSPLLLGVGADGITIASDVMALIGHADRYFPIDDKTFTIVQPDDRGFAFSLFDIIGNPVASTFMPIDFGLEDVGKGGYSHYMLKEICEQPAVVRRIMAKYLNNDVVQIPEATLAWFREAERIYIIAAGTSMHAGYVGKYLIEHLAALPVEVFIASEFAYNPPLLVKNPLFVFISQSGETADLRACLVDVKRNGHRTVAITNVPTSTLAREADRFLEIFAGPEIAVASTKAYVGQIVILATLAWALAPVKPFDLHHELSRVAVAMEAVIDHRESIHALVRAKITKRNCFYIGRGLDYFACLEAALKLKEISYIQTEGFAAGELKHGTIALIENGVPVIAIISQAAIARNTRSNVREVLARGAEKIVIATNDVAEASDDIILMDVHDMLSPLITILPAQLIAFYAALDLGRDIDKPRNLAKSVTVE